ncbi:protein of unknown function [Burkholderia multivorans]
MFQDAGVRLACSRRAYSAQSLNLALAYDVGQVVARRWSHPAAFVFAVQGGGGSYHDIAQTIIIDPDKYLLLIPR